MGVLPLLIATGAADGGGGPPRDAPGVERADRLPPVRSVAVVVAAGAGGCAVWLTPPGPTAHSSSLLTSAIMRANTPLSCAPPPSSPSENDAALPAVSRRPLPSSGDGPTRNMGAAMVLGFALVLVLVLDLVLAVAARAATHTARSTVQPQAQARGSAA